jgi:hypothetical protein
MQRLSLVRRWRASSYSPTMLKPWLELCHLAHTGKYGPSAAPQPLFYRMQQMEASRASFMGAVSCMPDGFSLPSWARRSPQTRAIAAAETLRIKPQHANSLACRRDCEPGVAVFLKIDVVTSLYTRLFDKHFTDCVLFERRPMRSRCESRQSR